MRISFRSRRLERRYHRHDEAVRAWGEDVGRRYIQRIDLLQEAVTVADLYAIRSLDFHPLRGDRSGQYALRITGQVRLVVTLDDDGVLIEEVVDYRG